MDWDIFWKAVSNPFNTLIDPLSRYSYYWMFTALLAAIAVYWWTNRQKGHASFEGLADWLIPHEILLHPSAKADYAMFFINKSLIITIYASILIQEKIWYDVVEQWMGPAPLADPSALAIGVSVLLIVLAFDFALWFAHYLFHKVPFLWEFHKSHHSAEVMTPITAVRMHPVDEFVHASLGAFAIGVTAALCDQMFGKGAQPFGLIGLNLFLLVFYALAFNLRHTHVWLPYPHKLAHILIAPAQHQIHHSRARKHWDKNMGFIFAIWDWAAGTLYAPKEREEIDYGLGNGEDGTWNTVRALYFRPFVNAYGLFRKGWRHAFFRQGPGADAPQTQERDIEAIDREQAV